MCQVVIIKTEACIKPGFIESIDLFSSSSEKEEVVEGVEGV